MKHLIANLLRTPNRWYSFSRLPCAAKAEHVADRRGVPDIEPSPDSAVEAGVRWICRAQEQSASQDGGVARHFSLIDGWCASYPETTGYIIPTLLAYSTFTGDIDVRERARRMLDWLASIQLPDGGFQGSVIGASNVVPVTFNTGQILLGLAEGVREFGKYHDSMCQAADWLVSVQDHDGCWRVPSPFTAPGEKTYETHAAWGLLEAARVVPDSPYAAAAMANVLWALRYQRPNGWFDKCCLTDSSQPLTHTIGYALRGIVEAYRFSREQALLVAAQRTADGLLTALRADGFLPGRLDRKWCGTVRWACLTGSVQIACCWFMLYQYTGDDRYRQAGLRANRFVRRTMKTVGPLETRGAIKGSFPVNGGYCTFQYPNWATKFFVDANMLELRIENGQ